MPKIELVLPGETRKTVLNIAETYRITVERDDGFACSDIEARTAMGTICAHSLTEKKHQSRKRQLDTSEPQ